MRFGTLAEELNSITKDYDYGIVPGSAAVFVKDEVMGIGRLDLTLLESVIVVIEVSRQGYKIASSSPLSHDPKTLAAAERVQSCVDRECFDTMENLLMTASPLFHDRFQASLYDKLDNAQQLQYPPLDYSNPMAQSTIPSPPQQQAPSLSYPYNEQHTNVPPQPVLPPSSYTTVNHTTARASNQQDLMDEINEWIH
ncbi:hypothetical protein BCR42DRAFT_404238 [Absidia repens]|uniref:GSKIP domain-containing protein n=1 Tax=Absidia repens TaxID=90262 RepID=A0A1X2IVX8_9FUNG|nr:hypothetical protein BCR42DRAFT_404238 [Absidia repens]